MHTVTLYFWPGSMSFDSVNADSSVPELDRPHCSYFSLLLWHSVVAMDPLFFGYAVQTTHHDIMGHLWRQVVNFVTKTMAHIG